MKKIAVYFSVFSILVNVAWAGSCQNQLVPLYTFPTSLGTQYPWSLFYGMNCIGYNTPLGAGLTRWVVMSPTLTPGSLQDPNWVAVTENAHTLTQAPSGTKALVYIDLNFGTVTEATVEAEIALAVSLYFGAAGSTLYFDGIFFDRTPGTQANYTGSVPASYSQYLTDIINYAIGTSFGSGVDYWMNTGFYPDEGVMNLVAGVNTRVILENTYASWSGIDVPDMPSWLVKYAASRFASIVHDTTASQMYSGTALAGTIHQGTVYFSDGTGGNPYLNLPSYWIGEIGQTNSGC
jgi:hypothetical protein